MNATNLPSQDVNATKLSLLEYINATDSPSLEDTNVACLITLDYYNQVACLGKIPIHQPSCTATKQSIQYKTGQLQMLLSACGNPDALRAVNTHIGNPIIVLKTFNNQCQVRKLPANRYYAPNKKVKVSPIFFTKAKEEIFLQIF